MSRYDNPFLDAIRQNLANFPNQYKGNPRLAKDLGIAFGSGTISLAQALEGLVDIPTQGKFGDFVDRRLGEYSPSALQDTLQGMYSEKAKRENQRIADADGWREILKTVTKNPESIARAGVAAIPSILGGGTIARGAAKVLPSALRWVTPGIGEGTLSAGLSASQIRDNTGTLTPTQGATAATSGAITGALGIFGGKIARKFGLSDVDSWAAGIQQPAVRKSLTRLTIGGAISEGFLEELPQSVQEQILQNQASGRPLSDGVDEAAVMGTLTGALMGSSISGGRAARPKITEFLDAHPQLRSAGLSIKSSDEAFTPNPNTPVTKESLATLDDSNSEYRYDIASGKIKLVKTNTQLGPYVRAYKMRIKEFLPGIQNRIAWLKKGARVLNKELEIADKGSDATPMARKIKRGFKAEQASYKRLRAEILFNETLYEKWRLEAIRNKSVEEKKAYTAAKEQLMIGAGRFTNPLDELKHRAQRVSSDRELIDTQGHIPLSRYELNVTEALEEYNKVHGLTGKNRLNESQIPKRPAEGATFEKKQALTNLRSHMSLLRKQRAVAEPPPKDGFDFWQEQKPPTKDLGVRRPRRYPITGNVEQRRRKLKDLTDKLENQPGSFIHDPKVERSVAIDPEASSSAARPSITLENVIGGKPPFPSIPTGRLDAFNKLFEDLRPLTTRRWGDRTPDRTYPEQRYVVITPAGTKFKQNQIISDAQYQKAREQYGDKFESSVHKFSYRPPTSESSRRFSPEVSQYFSRQAEVERPGQKSTPLNVMKETAALQKVYTGLWAIRKNAIDSGNSSNEDIAAIQIQIREIGELLGKEDVIPETIQVAPRTLDEVKGTPEPVDTDLVDGEVKIPALTRHSDIKIAEQDEKDKETTSGWGTSQPETPVVEHPKVGLGNLERWVKDRLRNQSASRDEEITTAWSDSPQNKPRPAQQRTSSILKDFPPIDSPPQKTKLSKLEAGRAAAEKIGEYIPTQVIPQTVSEVIKNASALTNVTPWEWAPRIPQSVQEDVQNAILPSSPESSPVQSAILNKTSLTVNPDIRKKIEIMLGRMETGEYTQGFVQVEPDEQSSEGGTIETYIPGAAGDPIYKTITQLAGTYSSRTDVIRTLQSIMDGKPPRSRLVPAILAIAKAQVDGKVRVNHPDGYSVRIR
tara:strand:- start:46 stop:3498 length:3453 start_codon:yes stop_codon:yes gene_type:complete